MRPARKYQYDAVEEALKRLGGYAALADLYREALKVPGVEWGTQTPFASIRRIVQKMPERFFRIRPGLWGLVERRGSIEALFGAENATPTKTQSEFTHTYYQGLVVELGRLKNYSTYVPAQDRNRSFKGGTLGEVADMTELPPFTYPRILNEVKSIDVIWFNERGMPSKVFEIEFTTDFARSMQKFVELQDFMTSLVVVADVSRRAEFETKSMLEVFRPIRDRVAFLNYSDLTEAHEGEDKASRTRRILG